jgi:hypothetical protein
MPNLDFYGIDSDLDRVLEFVFSQPGLRVFESYSAFSQELTEFTSADLLKRTVNVGICKGDVPSALLQLVVPSASTLYRVRRITLSSDKCEGHSFRHAIDGWGLIQLYLGGIGPNGIVRSHTNHNSPARARAWEQTVPDMGSAKWWDWAQVTSVSSALNRFIRNKLSVSKLGSRPVLPAAQNAFAGGMLPSDTFGKAQLEASRAAGLS